MHGAAGQWQVVTLTTGSKRRSLLMAEDDDKKSQRYATPKTTEQHLIVRSDKSVAYVTNNKRLRSTSFTVLLLTNTKHARLLCDSRATCYTRECCDVMDNIRGIFSCSSGMFIDRVRHSNDELIHVACCYYAPAPVGEAGALSGHRRPSVRPSV